MGNRKKTRREKRDKFLARIKGQTGLDVGTKIEGQVIEPPNDEKTVLKTVPATIKFAEWDEVDRDDEEVIGETVIYTDGSFDMVVNRDISPEAQSIVNFLHGNSPRNVSLAKE